MTNYDDYFTGDEVIKQKAYSEFQLTKDDKDSIESIEKGLASKTINSSNRSDSLEYLETLYQKISQVKRNEYEYEGDNNMNVNSYLLRIQNLINKLRQL